MTDFDKLRAFAQGLIDEAAHIVDECGVAGGHAEIERAEAGKKLIELIDSWPAIEAHHAKGSTAELSLTSPERIPPAIRAGIDRYAKDGIRPGSCLYAILAGDLFGAFARADPGTVIAMPAIVAYIASEVGARGDEAIVERWIARPRS